MRRFSLLVILGVWILTACTTNPTQIPSETATGVNTPAGGGEASPVVGTVQSNGITIAYESYGDPQAETILFISGTGQHLVDWPKELVETLVGRGYHVVLYDNRDIGLSTKMTEAGWPDGDAIFAAISEGRPAPIPYTLYDMAADAVGLLDALEIRQAHLIGMSMGGGIAQIIAIDNPERVLSMTTIGADSGNPELPDIANPDAFAEVPPLPTEVDEAAFIEWQVKTWQALAGSAYQTDEALLREWAQRDFERNFDPAALVRQQIVSGVSHQESSEYRFSNLENITAPALVIHGTEDPLVAPQAAEDLAARIPNAELWLIPGLGHYIPAELAQDFADRIVAVAERAPAQ